MATVGRAIRQAQAHNEWVCTSCGHKDAHRELQPTTELRNGEIVTVEHPDYQPGEFYCDHEGCGCKVVK